MRAEEIFLDELKKLGMGQALVTAGRYIAPAITKLVSSPAAREAGKTALTTGVQTAAMTGVQKATAPAPTPPPAPKATGQSVKGVKQGVSL